MRFCKRCPALYYAIGALSGISLSYGFWPPLFLSLLSWHPIRFCGYLLIALASFLSALSGKAPHPKETLSGEGLFSVYKIREDERGGHIYYGKLTGFQTAKELYFDIPASFWIKKNEERLPANTDFFLKGTLIFEEKSSYRLLVKNLIPVEKSYSLSELRFSLKQKIRAFLLAHTKNPFVYAFFVSLVTGEQENPILGYQFSRVGLSHTLALSGFHYTYLIFALSFLLRLFFYKRLSIYFLIIFISLYFLFIGETPSLSRAWLAALIYLLGFLLRRESFGLNALGVGLLVSSILDPKAPLQIGYQLTYFATFALFTFYPYIEDKLRYLLPKRPFETLSLMSPLHQHGYILSSLIRESLALTIAVNLATMPLVIYHFQIFPLASFLYNLFFVYALIPSMAGLFLSFLLLPLAPWILSWTELYAKFFLDIVFYTSPTLASALIIKDLPALTAALLILFLIPIGIYLEERKFAVDI
ncbi:MAG: ComEC/Rec2 family competence protein [Verrucomicrobia bacterium]|nr:ComEC/Rec2 family competence protein [Verrucomicrobiota bacterium]